MTIANWMRDIADSNVWHNVKERRKREVTAQFKWYKKKGKEARKRCCRCVAVALVLKTYKVVTQLSSNRRDAGLPGSLRLVSRQPNANQFNAAWLSHLTYTSAYPHTIFSQAECALRLVDFVFTVSCDFPSFFFDSTIAVSVIWFGWFRYANETFVINLFEQMVIGIW